MEASIVIRVHPGSRPKGQFFISHPLGLVSGEQVFSLLAGLLSPRATAARARVGSSFVRDGW